jgi:hypothetical protein
MIRHARILLGSAAAGVVLLLAVGGLFVPLDTTLRLDARAIGTGPSMAHPLGRRLRWGAPFSSQTQPKPLAPLSRGVISNHSAKIA